MEVDNALYISLYHDGHDVTLHQDRPATRSSGEDMRILSFSGRQHHGVWEREFVYDHHVHGRFELSADEMCLSNGVLTVVLKRLGLESSTLPGSGRCCNLARASLAKRGQRICPAAPGAFDCEGMGHAEECRGQRSSAEPSESNASWEKCHDQGQ